MSSKLVLLMLGLVMFCGTGFAQRVELGPEKSSEDWRRRAESLPTGRAAAGRLMNRAVASEAGDRYLALHFGGFANSQAYRWGTASSWQNKAKSNVGVTYRVGEWTRAMDLLFRADLLTFNVDNSKPVKLSFMPVVSFPDSRSRFPLFFGAGLGAGVFLKQLPGESSLSLDYNLVLGARFFDVFDSVGLLFESGLKGHIHLLSSGQFDSTYLSAGAVFSF